MFSLFALLVLSSNTSLVVVETIYYVILTLPFHCVSKDSEKNTVNFAVPVELSSPSSQPVPVELSSPSSQPVPVELSSPSSQPLDPLKWIS